MRVYSPVLQTVGPHRAYWNQSHSSGHIALYQLCCFFLEVQCFYLCTKILWSTTSKPLDWYNKSNVVSHHFGGFPLVNYKFM